MDILFESPLGQDAAPHISFAIMILNRVFRRKQKQADFLIDGRGDELVKHLLQICKDSSLKKTDFCGLVFKFLQIFLNPEDQGSCQYLIRNNPNFASDIIDLMVTHVQQKKSIFILQSGT